ncbi:MAG: hypothetical protein ACLUNZ_08900 [Evtepia sp.]
MRRALISMGRQELSDLIREAGPRRDDLPVLRRRPRL